MADDGNGEPLPPTCELGYHLEDGQCVVDEKPPTCPNGYHFEGDKCVPNNADSGQPPIPPECGEGYELNDNGVCVSTNTTPTCGEGEHLDTTTNTCVADTNTTCPEGQHLENGTCVEDRNLDNIPYSQWTEEEKAQKSMEICNVKLQDDRYSVLRATEVRPEGFSNEKGTLILHSNKTPIVNGVKQNVTITMIYIEIPRADPNNKMLDATYRVPRFRIDYTIDYADKTFYVIDEAKQTCYVNTFPNENSIPFGVLQVVAPDDVKF